jgi:hypothetical protein
LVTWLGNLKNQNFLNFSSHLQWVSNHPSIQKHIENHSKTTHRNKQNLFLGISRDSRHKRSHTGAKRAQYRKKRKFEMGRQAANTKIGAKRIPSLYQQKSYCQSSVQCFQQRIGAYQHLSKGVHC